MTTTQQSQQPEKKFTMGDVSLTIWRNSISTPRGQKLVRKISLTGRRYQDSETGEWKGNSFRPVDLSIVGLLCRDAQSYMEANPLPDVDESALSTDTWGKSEDGPPNGTSEQKPTSKGVW